MTAPTKTVDEMNGKSDVQIIDERIRYLRNNPYTNIGPGSEVDRLSKVRPYANTVAVGLESIKRTK